MTKKDKLSAYFAPTIERWRSQRTPYVWSLALTLRFFEESEALLLDAIEQEEGVRFLESEEFAPIALIMLGEWYKRRYAGSSEDFPNWIRDIDWKTVWTNSGVRNWKRWVYSFSASGNYSWLYSGMVLGGLACVFEKNHDRGNRLLRDLCRIFHGEENLQLDASSRAQALRESIEKEGSIYRFIMEMTEPNSSLNEAYNADSQEEVRNLRKTILEVNRQVIQSKLNSEWVITTSPYQQESISKTLRVKLRPERVDGERRWFLSRERAEDWGFKLSSDLTDITLCVRFYLKGVALPKDVEVLHFQASGKTAAGFNTIEPEHMGVVGKLPELFDAWRLVAHSNDGQEVEVDATLQNVGEFDQIYQMASNTRLWGSNYRRRKSVVVFSDRCRVTDPQNHPVASKRLLIDYQPTGHVNWAEIPAYVILRYPIGENGEEREVRLVSPLAGCKVVVSRQYPKLLNYQPGGEITVQRTDNNTGEVTERNMPLLFGTEGIKFSWSEDGSNPEILDADTILFRQGGEEVEAENLREGVTEVTVRAKGMEAKAEVWYMPDHGKDAPLTRDLDKKKVRWADGKTVDAPKVDEQTGLMPTTVRTTRGSVFHDKAIVDIYTPVRRREVLLDGHLVKIDETGEPLNLALLNLADISVRIFDENGFEEWIGASNLNTFKRLVVNQSNTVPAGKGNIVVHNSIANMKLVDGKKYGTLTMMPDPEGKLIEYPQIVAPKSTGPFGPRQKGLQAKEALAACVDDNLYSFMFESVRRLNKDIIPFLSEILADKDDDYIKSHAPAIKRILWENDKSTRDLIINGIKL